MGTVIVIIVIIAIIIIATLSKKHPNQTTDIYRSTNTSRDKQKEIDIPVKITVTTSMANSSIDREVFPPVKATDNGDFILNPKAPFELTLQSATPDVANKIRSILDDEKIYSSKKEEQITALFAEHNLKVKEIEAYKKKYEKVFRKKIEELKKSSNEWTVSSEMDKEDILGDFRRVALKEIYEKANCDLITLFENEPKDITIDDELIKEYGFANIEVYLRFGNELEKVRVIPNDNYNRQKFEELVELGLAIRGAAIPKELILPTLTLKELNEIANHPDKQFKRKNQAIEYILQLPNLDELLGKKISFRELFKLNPLPAKYSSINLTELSNTWNYTYEVVNLLISTYSQSYYTYLTLKEDREYIKEYKVHCYNTNEDMCPCAKELKSKSYPKSRPPRIPYHVGCNCFLEQEYKFD